MVVHPLEWAETALGTYLCPEVQIVGDAIIEAHHHTPVHGVYSLGVHLHTKMLHVAALHPPGSQNGKAVVHLICSGSIGRCCKWLAGNRRHVLV